MLEDKLKGVKIKVAALAISAAGMFAGQGCANEYNKNVLDQHGVTCCNLTPCNPGGTCRTDEIEYRDGVPYVTCSCHYPHTQHPSSSPTPSENAGDRWGGFGDRDNHGGTHRECRQH
jgi:hypothetical protein